MKRVQSPARCGTELVHEKLLRGAETVDTDKVKVLSEKLGCFDHCFKMRWARHGSAQSLADQANVGHRPFGRVEATLMVTEAVDIDLYEVDASVEDKELEVLGRPGSSVAHQLFYKDPGLDVLVYPFMTQRSIVLTQPTAAAIDQCAPIEPLLVEDELYPP
jgi:hypothetical protein